jgi:drug/metabolite transporter (DMT)-like permease
MSAPPTATTERPASASAGAYLSLSLGVLFIGFAPIFIRLADAPGVVVGAYRLTIASLALAVPTAINARRGRARLTRRGLWLGILGGLAFAGDIGLWSTAVTLGNVSTTTFLGNTAPLWVALGAWLIFSERLRPQFWLGLLVAMGGALLLVGLDGFGGSAASAGNFFALGAAVIYAGYQLITSRVGDHVDNLTYMWMFTAVGALTLIAVSLLLGYDLRAVSPAGLRALIGLALITHIGGWLLINQAFSRLRPTLVSVALLGQPIIATVVAGPVLGEIPTVWGLLGGLLTLVGIYVVMRSHQS